MREIKFRAWKESEFIGKMIYYPKSAMLGSGEKFTLVDVATRVVFENVMQFTGLKDRNGNEIYDRTILRFFIDGKVFNEELYEVSYSEERACWQINCIKKCNHLDSPVYMSRHLTQTLAECFEIAGNVFENPELKE